MTKTEIPYEVDQGVRKYLLEGFGKEMFDQLQIEIESEEGFLNDRFERLYTAWIYRPTGLHDLETGDHLTVSNWAKFCCVKGRVSFIAGSMF